MNRIAIQINKDLQKMLEKHIDIDVAEVKESMKREVCSYMQQFYCAPEFDITVEQDEDDENKLIINIDSKEDKE